MKFIRILFVFCVILLNFVLTKTDPNLVEKVRKNLINQSNSEINAVFTKLATEKTKVLKSIWDQFRYENAENVEKVIDMSDDILKGRNEFYENDTDTLSFVQSTFTRVNLLIEKTNERTSTEFNRLFGRVERVLATLLKQLDTVKEILYDNQKQLSRVEEISMEWDGDMVKCFNDQTVAAQEVYPSVSIKYYDVLIPVLVLFDSLQTIEKDTEEWFKAFDEINSSLEDSASNLKSMEEKILVDFNYIYDKTTNCFAKILLKAQEELKEIHVM